MTILRRNYLVPAKQPARLGAAFSDRLVQARQNGLLTSSAIDDQQVPISRSSRSLRAASSRRACARARQIRTVERIFRTRTASALVNALDGWRRLRPLSG